MITPREIRNRALRLWTRQDLLRAHLEGKSLFPLDIPFAKPPAAALSERFAEVRAWIQHLKSASKDVVGHGYRLHVREVNHRRLGAQSLPDRIVLETQADTLRLIGKQKEFEQFARQAGAILAEWPALKPFLIQRPMTVLEHEPHWDQLRAVCRHLVEHPLPMRYARQLDIAGVDTKFIDAHRGLLGELLDILLPDTAKQEGVWRTSDYAFERRFGLRFDTPLIRFRLLDTTLKTGSWTDMTLPLKDFEQLSLPVRRVFIVENKINGLAFPPHPKSLVIFGLGYSVNLLSGASWLSHVDMRYWGDIDTHGFAILNRLRTVWPHTQSFFMDTETLHAFRNLWGQEPASQRFTGELVHLQPEERDLYEALRSNRFGERIRLEQERISWSYLENHLKRLPNFNSSASV